MLHLTHDKLLLRVELDIFFIEKGNITEAEILSRNEDSYDYLYSFYDRVTHKCKFKRYLTEDEFVSIYVDEIFNAWVKDTSYDIVPVPDELRNNGLSESAIKKIEDILTQKVKEEELKWAQENRLAIEEKARALGCSPQLAGYITNLVNRLNELEQKYERYSNR